MKKIFAIALALVMVLSMASAFAWCVTDINWACATDVCENGTGSVEVIPYVKGNGCGTGNTWTPSTCAGAVNGDLVYFAVKVTVDADPNEEWWEAATLEITEKGMSTFVAGTADREVASMKHGEGVVAGLIADLDDEKELKAGEYYLVYTTEWEAVEADDFDASVKGSLFAAKVDEAAKAKVCAKLESENEVDTVVVNGYTVELNPDAVNILEITKDGKTVQVETDKDDEVVAFKVNVGDGWETIETYNVKQTKFYAKSTETYDWTCDDLGKFLKKVMEDFELDFGICVTEKAVKANFGWEDKVESCFSWNSDVQAVVNAECVVAIPKTGDASVLAWLF